MKEQYQCFVDPCQYAKCTAYPDATCTSNYCGGCNAVFTNGFSVDITDQCDNDVCLLPTAPGSCRGSMQRWTYNSESEQCEEFTYGGCQVRFYFMLQILSLHTLYQYL